MLDVLPTLSDQELDTRPDTEAGFGALTTTRGALPLVALDVRARIDGLIALVEVCQTFLNSHDQPLEATYIFPLPDRAAVTSFRLEVAGRVVEGELQERGQARQNYNAALQAGHRAAIAEEERPGVFTMRVGNLPPGERAVVRLVLVGPLPYSDGGVTFRFPLVVAPRYIPGTPLPGPAAGDGIAPDTDAVPDASRISPPVLLPGFPNPVRLGIAVEMAESPLAPHSFRSSLHTIVEQASGKVFRIRPGERMDRDFILRWRLGGVGIQTALLVRPDAQGEEGTFLLAVVPPATTDEPSRSRDVVFVLDRSGSMSGWKMVAARRAVARMVETLTERDRFTVYAFDDSIETPPGFDGLALVRASDRQRFRAAEFLAGIDDRGGTEMAQPLEHAVTELSRSGEPSRTEECRSARGTYRGGVDRVLVLITDGQVGNEDDILRRLGPRVQGIRIFTLGIDRAVNAAFLRRLADLGGGASEVVESEGRLDEVMDQVHRHIGTPVLTALTLRSSALELVDLPRRLPDLFAGAPVQISGRYRGEPRGAWVLSARDVHGEKWSAEVFPTRTDTAPLALVWARGRIRELEDAYLIQASERARLEKAIVSTSLRFGVLSRFTAFVAVDRSDVVNAGGGQKKVTQAVEQPAGWGQRETLSACPPPPAPAGVVLSQTMSATAPRMASRQAQPPARGGFAGFALVPFDTQAGDSEFELSLDACDADEDGDSDNAVEWGRTRRPRKRARRERQEDQGGLWQRLKAFFGFSETKLPAPPDLQVLRTRGEELRKRLEDGMPDDASARLAALCAAMPELKALLLGLLAMPDQNAPVIRMTPLFASLRELLEAKAPDADRVNQTWQGIVAALRDWLGMPPAQAPAQAEKREAFWK
jgi:Ca-activated chloride channel family protein